MQIRIPIGISLHSLFFLFLSVTLSGASVDWMDWWMAVGDWCGWFVDYFCFASRPWNEANASRAWSESVKCLLVMEKQSAAQALNQPIQQQPPTTQNKNNSDDNQR